MADEIPQPEIPKSGSDAVNALIMAPPDARPKPVGPALSSVTGEPMGRKPGIPGTISPTTNEPVPYTDEQKIHPWEGVMAHVANIHNPVARTAARMGALAGMAVSGFEPEKQTELREKTVEAGHALDIKNAELMHAQDMMNMQAEHYKDMLGMQEKLSTAKNEADILKTQMQQTGATEREGMKETAAGAKNANKVTYNKGLPVTITDSAGKVWDANDPNLPPEQKQHIATANAAYKQSTADALANRVKGYETLAAPRWAQLNLAEAKNAQEISDVGLQADFRLKKMRADLPKAMNGDQQAMVDMLFNHMGMTSGQIKGGRITQEMINEARTSAPWIQVQEAHFDKDGYLTGIVLTPETMNQMLDLAERVNKDTWEMVHEKQGIGKQLGVPVPSPESQPKTGEGPLSPADWLAKQK